MVNMPFQQFLRPDKSLQQFKSRAPCREALRKDAITSQWQCIAPGGFPAAVSVAHTPEVINATVLFVNDHHAPVIRGVGLGKIRDGHIQHGFLRCPRSRQFYFPQRGGSIGIIYRNRPFFHSHDKGFIGLIHQTFDHCFRGGIYIRMTCYFSVKR